MTFAPQMDETERTRLLAGWHKAVGRSCDWAELDSFRPTLWFAHKIFFNCLFSIDILLQNAILEASQEK